jgi:hypothetical protein
MRRLMVCLFLLPLFLVATGCGSNAADSRWFSAQQQGGRNHTAVAKEALPGKEFNKFFPKAEAPWDLTYKQEKPGTAIAALKKDGKEVATLTVFDTISEPDIRKDYKETTEALVGCPLVAKGAKGTAILIANRFQVQVRSSDDSFTDVERKEWLKKFDIDGIAKLNE